MINVEQSVTVNNIGVDYNIINTIINVNQSLIYDRVITVSPEVSTYYYMYLAKQYRDQAEYYASLSMPVMKDGERITGVHAGIFKEMSLTDDYVYICVVGGDSNTAIWKRFILFKT